MWIIRYLYYNDILLYGANVVKTIRFIEYNSLYLHNKIASKNEVE